MSVLVTGATGLMGNNLVRFLVEQGETVRVLVRETTPNESLTDLPVEPIRVDLAEPQGVTDAVAGNSCVYHCAGYVKIGWSDMDLARRINVDGTRAIADACRRTQTRLVHVSTVNTLPAATNPEQTLDETSPGEPAVPCPYVVTKCQAEREVHRQIELGLDAVIVHPGFMLGPYDWKPSSGQMLLEVLQRRPPLAPPGGCSVVDVRDVVAGTLAAAARGGCGEHYILAGVNLTYLELWRKFAGLKGRPGAFGRLGPLVRLVSGWIGDAQTVLTGREGGLNSAAVRMGCLFHYYSSAKAQGELGYTLRPLEETLADAYRWFCETGRLRAA